MKKASILISLVIMLFAFTSDKPAYQFYNSKGKKVKYSKVLKEASKADIVFFGELHNNPVNHWLEYELTKDLFEKKDGQISMGAEMFESDNQIIIDEYFENKINQRNFEKECRLWPNYQTDYKPLLEFAKENSVEFIATNIPRRYASFVHKQGLDSLSNLSQDALRYIAPLPIEYDPEVACYKEMLSMMSGMGHANPKLPMAQAVKDATMAHFIAENLKNNHTFIHYNGTYHSDNYEGIIWYLKKLRPELNIVTIASIESPSTDTIAKENINKGTFILSVPESMTKTY